MNKNFYCRIDKADGRAMSQFKTATPKMINEMKELCIKYEKMFGEKYTVRRYIPTPKGMKKI